MSKIPERGLSAIEARALGVLWGVSVDNGWSSDRVCETPEQVADVIEAERKPRTDRTVQVQLVVRPCIGPQAYGHVVHERTITVDDRTPRPTMVGRWRDLYKGLNRSGRVYMSFLIRLAMTVSQIPRLRPHQEEAQDALWRVIRSRNEDSAGTMAIVVCKRACEEFWIGAEREQPEYQIVADETPLEKGRSVVSYGYVRR